MDPQKPDPLKCPRCDSSNTKFCYYNNYSLSQPRHFCKACKRYWTRGGTLRNVPVGGGCRKNKRASKRPPSSEAAPPPQLTSAPSNINRIHNPLFYSNNSGNNPIELNFPFSSFRVSSDNNNINNPGFDLHSQMTGFSASGLDHHHNHNHSHSHSHAGLKPYQDVPAFSGHHNSIFFGSSGLGSASTMASLLAIKGVQAGLMPYEDPGKAVKVEGENNRSVWNPSPNPIDQINNSSDPLLWNNAWFDPSNMGSSVPSLI